MKVPAESITEKVKRGMTTWLNNSTPGYITQGGKKTHVHTDTGISITASQPTAKRWEQPKRLPGMCGKRNRGFSTHCNSALSQKEWGLQKKAATQMSLKKHDAKWLEAGHKMPRVARTPCISKCAEEASKETEAHHCSPGAAWVVTCRVGSTSSQGSQLPERARLPMQDQETAGTIPWEGGNGSSPQHSCLRIW